MSSPETSEQHGEIWSVVRRINQASIQCDLATLQQLTYEDMVIIPEFMHRVKGQQLYLDSVNEFAGRGEVIDYREIDPNIEIFGDTAVASFQYESEWKSNNESYHEKGKDIWVLKHFEDTWKLVWRTLLPDPAP
jgi:ketosteroid isomerase-like protein